MGGGVEMKIHFFVMDLPHSDAGFVRAYPAETTEAFCDGHRRAFEFFGGVPRSILYDNTKIAVARILGDGKRQRTRVFSELQSHYLFLDRFGRPGKGNDKGKVENLVGYARRNFMVPVPRASSFEALNAKLLADCLRRRDDLLRSPIPRPSRSAWPATWRPSSPCRRFLTTPARRGRDGSARCPWSATGAPTTRCRPPTAIARC